MEGLSREGFIGSIGGGADAGGIHRTHRVQGLSPEEFIGFIGGGATARVNNRIRRCRGYCHTILNAQPFGLKLEKGGARPNSGLSLGGRIPLDSRAKETGV